MHRMTWPCLLALALVLTGCGKHAAVTISPRTATVQPGDPAIFTATVTGVKNTAVTWGLVEKDGGEVWDGMYNAPKRAGTFHIVAASEANPKATTVAVITVPPKPVIIDPIMVTLPLRNGRAAGPVAFTATAIGETGEHPAAVTWRVVEQDGGSITPAGVYTPPAKAGTYHVEAVSQDDPKAIAVAGVYIY